MDNCLPSYNHRRSIRLRDYDYAQSGAYFVTLCTYNKIALFGEILDGDMRLNMLGEIVDYEWQRTAQVRNFVELDAFVVMPNHIHGILLLVDDAFELNRPSKSPRMKLPTLQAGSLGAIIGQFKSTVTRRAKRVQGISVSTIWQRNFYEHIIRSEDSLNDIRKYIMANPARWSEDSLYVE